MKRYFVVILLCVSALLVACAKEQKKPPEAAALLQNPIYNIPTPDLKTAIQIATNVKPECGKNKNCSLSVGVLTFATSKGAAQCTASLISPDIILTNTHCVPADLKASNSRCKGRMWMNFIPTSGYDSKIACDRILYASEKVDGKIDADYAYIKLAKKSNRPYLETTRDGFVNGETVELYKMNPIPVRDEKGFRGELEKVNCRVVMDSLLPRKFEVQASTSPYVTFSDCQIIPGNSGGPIVSTGGKIKGIIFALLKYQESNEYFIHYGFTSTVKNFQYMSVGTNLRCLKDMNLHESSSAECSNLLNDVEKARSIYYQNQIEANEKIRKLIVQQPKLKAFQWTFKTQTFVKDPKAEQKEYIHLSTLQPFCYVPELREQIVPEASISRPIFDTQISYDERFIPTYRFESVSEYKLDESLQIKEEGNELKVEFQPNSKTGLSSGLVASIPACY